MHADTGWREHPPPLDYVFGRLQQKLIVSDGTAKNRNQLLTLLNDLWCAHNQLRQTDKLRSIDQSLARQANRRRLLKAIRQIASNAAAKSSPARRHPAVPEPREHSRPRSRPAAAPHVNQAATDRAGRGELYSEEGYRYNSPSGCARPVAAKGRLTILSEVRCGQGTAPFRSLHTIKWRAVATWAFRCRSACMNAVRKQTARKCREILSTKLICHARARWAAHRLSTERLHVFMSWKLMVNQKLLAAPRGNELLAAFGGNEVLAAFGGMRLGNLQALSVTVPGPIK